MRFALVGAGGIGAVRKAALERAPGCSLTAVFDIDQDAARNLAGGAKVFGSMEELAASDVCDAVVISTPTNLHAPQALAAIAGGKHVIVEKPMASSPEQCREMMAAAREAGVALAVGFNQRYFSAVKDVRAAIQSGAIGKLSYIRSYAGHTGLSEFKSPWMYDKDVMGGGTLMDNGIHILDLTLHLMGGAESVSGIALRDVWQLDRSEDNGFALLRGAENVAAAVHSSWTEWKGYQTYIEAYGDRGMARAAYAPMSSLVITLDKPGGTPTVKRKRYLSAIFREKFRGWQTTAVQTFVEEFIDFVELATTGSTTGPIATAADGCHVIDVANAVYKSSDADDAVKVSKP